MVKGALIAALLLISGCSQVGGIHGAPPPEAVLPRNIKVMFNHSRHGSYRSPLNGQWRQGDDLEQFLIDAIQEADEEVLMAVQELSLPDVARALVAARTRGVAVRVILENSYSTPWSEQHSSHLPERRRRRHQQLQRLADRDGDGITTREEAVHGDAVAILRRAGLPLVDDTDDGSRGSGLMHHKFMVIDRRSVLTGSANFTSSGLHGDAGAPQSRGNVNHLLRLDSPDLAALFRQEFLVMWGDGPDGVQNSRFGLKKRSRGAQHVMVGDTKVEVLFSPHRKRNPDHGLNWLERQLQTARRSIDIAVFVFSAQQLGNALQNLAEDGVRLRLLGDPGFASRSFSELLDLLGVALPDHHCMLETGNQPSPKALPGVGTPRLARGDKLHHKFAVIDNRKVITGSFNWSPAAAHTNDETLLVIHSPQLARHFTREMDRMWDSAELGITPRIQRKLDRQKIRCGDGAERD